MKKIIGHCAVDSGQILLVDPCYLKDWKDGDVNFETKEVANHYDEASKITVNSPSNAGQMYITGFGTGVVAASGFGDGNYPVYATYENTGTAKKPDIRIKSLTIKFF